MAQGTCSIEGCEKPYLARGWCRMHYMRWRRHGDPSEGARPVGIDVPTYLKVRAPEHPLADKHGYVPVHRMVAWDEGILTDPDLHVHHKNHDRYDNRPENLVAMSSAEHIREHDLAQYLRIKTHCPQGHPYDEANTYITPRGHRVCRACGNARSRKNGRRG